MDAHEHELKADTIIRKIRHYLITMRGVTANEATAEEFYRAFAFAMREEIMINWTATARTYNTKQPRTLYYLCMEYLPGRFMGNNICNIHALTFIRTVMQKMGKVLDEELLYEPDPALGNGGLGRLASCLLDSLATQQYPALAYGLRYQYGIFDQEIWGGKQIERPDPWLLHENPWELRRDDHALSIYYGGKEIPSCNKKGEEIFDLSEYEEVRALPYDIPLLGYKETGDFNVNTLRLWTTKESPKNFQLQRFNAGHLDQASENTGLTDVLYPNDNNEVGKRIRLKQEFLLASASVQDIIAHYLRHYPDMSFFADKVRIQINDTHPALAIAELMHNLIKGHDFTWGEAWEVTKSCFSYTNHTILQEALEEWNQNRLRGLLPRQYRIIEKLNMDLCTQIRKQYPGEEEKVRRMSMIEGGQVKMAHLAIYGSHKVNGVATIHSEILRTQLFPDFDTLYPERFTNVTNGVTQRRWLLYANPQLAEFLIKRIGKKWITDFSQIAQIAAFAEDPESLQEFLEIKKQNKTRLRDFLRTQNPIRDNSGRILYFTDTLEEDALYDIQIKRIHEYKRQLLNILHVLMLYFEQIDHPEKKRTKRLVIFAGKAAPGYETAKQIIQMICCVAKVINNDPRTSHNLKVVFVENYNVSKAEILIPAADLSEQISTAGMEASGTGNMKLSLSGALTIGTEDGANIEMHESVGENYWPFAFGASASQVHQLTKDNSYNPWDIYTKEPLVRRVLDAMRNHTFAETENDQEVLHALGNLLLEGQNGNRPDPFFVLHDLMSYYHTQAKVEELFADPMTWAKYCIHNIAAMGPFSTDQSIHNYAQKIWEIQPCPIDPEILRTIRAEYAAHDQCRIF